MGGTPPAVIPQYDQRMTSSPPGMTYAEIRMTHHPTRMTYSDLAGMTSSMTFWDERMTHLLKGFWDRNDKVGTQNDTLVSKEWHSCRRNDRLGNKE